MQQILSFQMTPYYSFGKAQKSSLIAQFCRENRFHHIKNPILEAIQQPFNRNTIIEGGNVQLFRKLQLVRPELEVLFVGNDFTEEENQIRKEYKMIGKCICVQCPNYEGFRKALFPNLVLFYGPNDGQNLAAAQSLASTIGYCQVALAPNPNIFIKQFKKTVSYTVAGCYTSKQHLQILEHYFNIKVVHFQYNRIDVNGKSDYFDKQYQILAYLKSKCYYVPINGKDNPMKIMDDIGRGISPQLIYCAIDNREKLNYIQNYVKDHESQTLVLHIEQIMLHLKRKNVHVGTQPLEKNKLLNQIIFRNLNIKKVFVIQYPKFLPDILSFENSNRKFSYFLDLVQSQNIQYSQNFNTQMYFLQSQKRIVPQTLETSLDQYLTPRIKYWMVNGVAGSGKTTVSKLLNSEFGFKIIQFQAYIGPLKEKLLSPQDGEEVPLKKILNHFKQLFSKDASVTYVIDGLPYENKDLQEWIKVLGAPSLINLEVEQKQSIKRLRKKDQGDVNAQITEQDTTKAKQSQAKSQKFLEIIRSSCATVQVHQLNFNKPIILGEADIIKIFRKNVYLVQSHNGLIFQNIAQKYHLGFINLHLNKLSESPQLIRQMQNTIKDVIICYYKQTDQHLISQDLYWIQKNVGNIQYLGIWDVEETQSKVQNLKLQKPVVQQKPKVEGGEGEDKPAQQEGIQKPTTFDIFAYEWTKPTNPKNLSQWFLKSKKNVSKINSSNNSRQIFKDWEDIQKKLRNNQNIYQVFK